MSTTGCRPRWASTCPCRGSDLVVQDADHRDEGAHGDRVGAGQHHGLAQRLEAQHGLDLLGSACDVATAARLSAPAIRLLDNPFAVRGPAATAVEVSLRSKPPRHVGTAKVTSCPVRPTDSDEAMNSGGLLVFVRRIAVIGSGYVGLTTGACLASLGHHVVCADADEGKVERLARGEIDIVEPGMAELGADGIAAGRLSFVVGAAAATTALAAGGVPVEVVFLCVPTPMGIGGFADLSAVEIVLEEIRDLLPSGCVVVNKSTVPVGTATRSREILEREDVSVVSNPEFLREGSAVRDFLNPDRVVVGSDSQDAAERVAALYSRLGAPTVLTDAASAEMIKYTANCFLAMKLSYVNAVAELCERLGADVADVAEGIGYDRRIGQAFLSPGPGWGGSCLPKDTQALLQVADSVDFEFRLLRATIETNVRQHRRIVDKVRKAVTGRCTGSLSRTRLALLGLTFKSGTDDLRGSPSLEVAALLRQGGAELVGYDPAVSSASCPPAVHAVVSIHDDPYLTVKDVDAVVILTEWPEFRSLDWVRIAEAVRKPVVVDTRNLLDPDVVGRAGLSWVGLGRNRRARDVGV